MLMLLFIIKYGYIRIVARNNVLVHHNYIVLVYRSLELCRVQTKHHYVTVTLQWAVGQFAAMAGGMVC